MSRADEQPAAQPPEAGHGDAQPSFHIDIELRNRRPMLELSGDFGASPSAENDLDKVLHQLDSIPAPLHVRTAALLALPAAPLRRLLAAAARRSPTAPLILDQVGPPIRALLRKLGISTAAPLNLTAELADKQPPCGGRSAERPGQPGAAGDAEGDGPIESTA